MNQKKQIGTNHGIKRYKVSLIFTVLFLAFLAILDYPFLARIYNQSRQNKAVVSYEENMGKIPEKEQGELLAAAQDYNLRLASGTGMKLASVFEEQEEEEADVKDSETKKFHEEYESLLNTDGSGVMGRIEIPKTGVDMLIYHGTSEDVLQRGAGHLEGSSLPVGGAGTHACLSAHRGLADKEMFSSLDELEIGDIFLIYVLGETLCYQVRDIRTVLPDDIEKLVIKSGEDLVTLITCTPYGINTHRLCVEGVRIPYTEDTEEGVQEQVDAFRFQRFIQNYGWILLSLVLVAAMGMMLWRYNKK